MVLPADVRRLAADLPDVVDASDDKRLELMIGGKGFAWTWLVREAPRRPRTPRLDVLAVRCPLAQKEMLIEAAPAIYFDEPHYRGFPAVLIRLAEVGVPELLDRLREALRRSAPATPTAGAHARRLGLRI